MEVKENTGQESLGKVFLRELVRASSWGIMFLAVVTILLLGGKQNIKEAIDFSMKLAVSQIGTFANNPEVKQEIKEALEYMSHQSNRTARKLLADPALKQDIKEAIDLWYAYKYRKIEPTGKMAETP